MRYSRLKELVSQIVEEEQTKYQMFFNRALKKFGVDSPADFKSDEEKKRFFNYIDKNWEAENETD